MAALQQEPGFYAPTSVVVDPIGNLLIADYWNHRIRKVNASTGTISTIVGDGWTDISTRRAISR